MTLSHESNSDWSFKTATFETSCLANVHHPPHDPGLHDAVFYLNTHTCVSLGKRMIKINIVHHHY